MAVPSRERRLIGNVWQYVTAEENGGNGGSQPQWTGPFTIYGLKWQTVDMSGEPPDAGTFKLSYGAEETAAIDFDASAAEVEAALNALPSLAGKVDVPACTFPSGTAEIVLDDSLAPFELLTVSNNSLTASAVPVADPAIYVYGSLTSTELLTPTAGDVLEDFMISVEEGFGAGSVVAFDTSGAGSVDWRTGATNGLDIENADEDGGANWTIPTQNLGPQSYHSLALAFAAEAYQENGNAPTLPCVAVTPSMINATVTLAGQGTGGILKVWVKLGTVQAPS